MLQKKKYSKLKKGILVLVVLITTFFIYVEILNRKSVNMTYRQKFLKAVYPAFIWWTHLTGKNNQSLTHENAVPAISFYALNYPLINGANFDFVQLKEKKVMLVNTASDCGYTNQYEGLEKLYHTYKNKLVIMGFPANDFKEQEKGSDQVIAEFCKLNYGVSFLLMKKSS